MNETPSIGAAVVTADGEDGECFKVDAPLQPDYWLAPDIIDVATPETVQLLLSKSDMAAEIRPATDHTGYHIHARET
jgi:hypothetical protein